MLPDLGIGLPPQHPPPQHRHLPPPQYQHHHLPLVIFFIIIINIFISITIITIIIIIIIISPSTTSSSPSSSSTSQHHHPRQLPSSSTLINITINIIIVHYPFTPPKLFGVSCRDNICNDGLFSGKLKKHLKKRPLSFILSGKLELTIQEGPKRITSKQRQN